MSAHPTNTAADTPSPAFLAELDPDSLLYRGLMTTGRAYALGDVFALVRRLSERIAADASDEDVMKTLVLNWSELLSWVEQASVEARDELRLMQDEIALAEPG